MNYVLVFITFIVLALTMVSIALLGSDRIFPARKVLNHISNDGIAPESDLEMPLVLSSRPTVAEVKRQRFSTSWRGYNPDEVDQALTLLAEENTRLRSQLEEKHHHA